MDVVPLSRTEIQTQVALEKGSRADTEICNRPRAGDDGMEVAAETGSKHHHPPCGSQMCTARTEHPSLESSAATTEPKQRVPA